MTTVFVGANLIDCTGSSPIADAVLVVKDRRIDAVGPRSRVSIPADAEVIDASGMTLIPGLINTHEHLAQPDPSDPKLDYAAEARLLHTSTMQYRQTFALRYGAQELRDGVTTVRILGERDFMDVGYQETFDRGLAPGPRVLTSGPAILTSAQYHAGWVSVVADGPEEVRAAVRRNIVRDVAVIKLIVSGGRRSGVPKNMTKCHFSREELWAAIDEAHKFDVKVTAHLNGGIGVDWAVEAGIDGIEHGMELSDHELELVAGSGTYVGLTMGWHVTDVYRRLLGDQRAELERYVRRLRQAGAKVVVGNDEVHGDHGLARQLILLTEFGVPAMEALEIGTRHGAIACGIDDKRGTLEVGRDADVIALRGDPLRDIGALRNVQIVMKAGAIQFGSAASA